MSDQSPAEGVPAAKHRPLFIIAADIRRNWPKPYFGAFPYIHALRYLDRVTDNYMLDSGVSIVAYFLSNAAS